MAQYMRVLSRPVSNCKLKNEHVLEMNDHGLFVTRPFYFCAPLSAINKLCCILPLAGAVFCLVWTLLFDFEESTKTHCNVQNFLPTYSKMVTAFTPQRYIIRFCIALYSSQQILIVLAYYKFYATLYIGSCRHRYRIIAALNSAFGVAEMFFLLGASVVSSGENYDLHSTLFLLFIICSSLYMTLSVSLINIIRLQSGAQQTPKEKMSLHYKTVLCICNIAAFAMAAYAYKRHNLYCEPGVYSVFSLFQYMMVLSNIGFHGTASIDFHTADLVMVDRLWHSSPTNGGQAIA